MYCPKCRSEYRKGFERCATCDVALVTELPPENTFASVEAMAKALENEEVTALVVGTIAGLREAQTFLAKERIATVVAGEAEDVEPGLMPRFFLMVAQQELPRAKEALERRWKDGVAAHGLMPAGDTSDTEHCPACSTAIPSGAAECPECGLFVGAAEEDAS